MGILLPYCLGTLSLGQDQYSLLIMSLEFRIGAVTWQFFIKHFLNKCTNELFLKVCSVYIIQIYFIWLHLLYWTSQINCICFLYFSFLFLNKEMVYGNPVANLPVLWFFHSICWLHVSMSHFGNSQQYLKEL